MESAVTAAVTGCCHSSAVLVSNPRSQAVIEVRLDALAAKVEKHNSMIERQHAIEKKAAKSSFPDKQIEKDPALSNETLLRGKRDASLFFGIMNSSDYGARNARRSNACVAFAHFPFAARDRLQLLIAQLIRMRGRWHA